MGVDQLITKALAAHLSPRGFESSYANRGLVIPTLGLTVRVRDVSHTEREDEHQVVVTVETGALRSLHGGIHVVQVGLGESVEAACTDAAHQWAVGVLPVLESYVLNKTPSDVTVGHMLVALDGTSDLYGWTVHIGPLIERVFGKIREVERPDQSALYRRLFNELHPFAAHSKLFWLECFAARFPGGRVDATCRYHNGDWVEGREVLLAWAAEWPDPGSGLLGRRQFLMFAPTAPSELPPSTHMIAQLRKKQSRRDH